MEDERGWRRSAKVITVIAFGEGPTEATFIAEVLAPAFVDRGIDLEARLIRTSPESKGGALTPHRVLHALRNTLLERGGTYVTTFFDLYGLRRDFYGMQRAHPSRDPLRKCKIIEEALAEAVVRESGCRPERFFPHIQPFEFEALLFSEVSSFGIVTPEWRPYLKELRKARDRSPSPEHINDGRLTHPSARLTVLKPRYVKPLHGSQIAASIGVATIRSECRHFGEWMTRLESLTPIR